MAWEKYEHHTACAPWKNLPLPKFCCLGWPSWAEWRSSVTRIVFSIFQYKRRLVVYFECFQVAKGSSNFYEKKKRSSPWLGGHSLYPSKDAWPSHPMETRCKPFFSVLMLWDFWACRLQRSWPIILAFQEPSISHATHYGNIYRLHGLCTVFWNIGGPFETICSDISSLGSDREGGLSQA